MRATQYKTLRRAFFARPSPAVARALLGKQLVSTIDGVETSGRIVETEAYLGPADDASHAAARIGRTARNATMFGPPGTAYVYLIYGVHWCLNVVTDRVGFPGAVLLRAIAPVSGIDTMIARRGAARSRDVASLGRGPGNLARALGVTRALDGHTLSRPPLLIADAPDLPDAAVAVGPRIGVTRARDWPLRFHVRSEPSVSR